VSRKKVGRHGHRIGGVSGDREPRRHRQDAQVAGDAGLERDRRAGRLLERRDGLIAIKGRWGGVGSAGTGR
jgi:hypothetical protein